MTTSQLRRFFNQPSMRHYQQVGEIQWGGMGAVVKVHDSTRDQFFALKILSTSNEKGAQRFQREIRALINLSNPHIVQIIDSGVFGSDFYYIMEWIEGRSLAELVRDSFRLTGQSLTPAKIQFYFTQLIEALSYCHSRAVIHRDLKPENIMIRDDDQLILIDFGLVREYKQHTEVSQESLIYSLTKSGELLGTPQYMSPEQVDFKGEFGPISFKTDVWALGATLHYVLTGQPPFSNQSIASLLVSILERPIDRTALPEDAAYQSLNKLCLNCLKKTPRQRPSLETVLTKISGQAQRTRLNTLKFALLFLATALLLAIGSLLFATSIPETPLEFSGIDKATRFTKESSAQISGYINGSGVLVSVGGQLAVSDENGHFSIQVQLQEGENEFRLVAQNNNSLEWLPLSIICDLRPPIVEIKGQKGDAVFVEKYLQGTVVEKHGGAKLTMNGEEITLEKDKFKYPLEDLASPQDLTLMVEDKAGNQSTLKIKAYTRIAQLYARFSPEQRREVQDYIGFLAQSKANRPPLRSLCHDKQWNRSKEEIQDRAIAIVGQRLGSDFQFVTTKLRECAGVKARIATFQHKKTGVEFQLIPGRLREMTWWRDPLFEHTLRYLEALAAENCNQSLIAMSLIRPPTLNHTPSLLRFMGRRETRVALNFMTALSLGRQIQDRDLPRFRAWFKQRIELKSRGKRSKKSTKYIPPFLIAKRELTLKQWKTLSELPSNPKNVFGVRVSWSNDLSFPMFGSRTLFLDWLKKADPRFRLPNRHEWVIAAQGGSEKRFFWGDDIAKMNDYAFVYSGTLSTAQSTNEHKDKTNAYGLSDVYGNVSEWVDPDWASWRKAWPRSTPINTLFQGIGDKDVLKWGLSMGGYSYTPPALCQSNMFFFQPVVNSGPLNAQRIGLRVALSIP